MHFARATNQDILCSFRLPCVSNTCLISVRTAQGLAVTDSDTAREAIIIDFHQSFELVPPHAA